MNNCFLFLLLIIIMSYIEYINNQNIIFKNTHCFVSQTVLKDRIFEFHKFEDHHCLVPGICPLPKKSPAKSLIQVLSEDYVAEYYANIKKETCSDDEKPKKEEYHNSRSNNGGFGKAYLRYRRGIKPRWW